MYPGFVSAACTPFAVGTTAATTFETSFVCRCAAPTVPNRRPAAPLTALANTTSMAAARAATAADAMLHFVYRVGSLDRTRRFLSILGLKVLRERDVPSEEYTNVFYGAGTESNGEHCSLELTYNYGRESYNVGDGFGHIGVAVPDVRKVCDDLRAEGFTISREPAPVKGGQSFMAFVEDPTGYRFELLQRVQRDPVCQVTLRVVDLAGALKFYGALGFEEVRRRSSDAGRYTNVKLGFGPEDDSTVLQLTHNWDRTEPYDQGDGWGVR
jgi:lactoylglutathione lyase